jgi:hypothetical protein
MAKPKPDPSAKKSYVLEFGVADPAVAGQHFAAKLAVECDAWDKLSALGFRVKEMVGGLEWWKDKFGYKTERAHPN